MKEANSSKKRSLLAVSRAKILFAILGLPTFAILLCGLPITFYLPHIRWAVGERFSGKDKVQGLPCHELPEPIATVDEWKKQTVENISFDLPPKVRDEPKIVVGKGLRVEDNVVIIERIPADILSEGQSLISREGKPLTLPEFWLKILNTKSSDFSWGLSYRDLDRHKHHIEISRQIIVRDNKSAECHFGDSQYVIIYGEKFIYGCWYSHISKETYHVDIYWKNDEIDKNWVRRLFRSIQVKKTDVMKE